MWDGDQRMAAGLQIRSRIRASLTKIVEGEMLQHIGSDDAVETLGQFRLEFPHFGNPVRCQIRIDIQHPVFTHQRSQAIAHHP